MSTGLKYRVLVLNRLWQAVNIVGVQRAFSLLLQDHAQVIYTGDENFQMMDSAEWLELSQRETPRDNEAYIQTVKMRIRVPKVLLLRSYDQLPAKEVRFSRETLFERDDYRCQYCGKKFPTPELSLDHVIPRRLGGRSNWENIVCACTQCNVKKGGRTPHQARMKLIKKPIKPKRNPSLALKLGHAKYASWKQFLDNAYWSVELR